MIHQFPFPSLVTSSTEPITSYSLSFSTGDAVVNVYINQEKRFAFVEMRTVEEASNAMALDGIIYEVMTCPDLYELNAFWLVSKKLINYLLLCGCLWICDHMKLEGYVLTGRSDYRK